MRTLIFVDEANFQKGARAANYRPDIIGLKNWLSDRGRRQIVEMVVYLGLPPERRAEDMPENWQRAYDSKHRLRMALENNGIMVVAWRGKQLFGYDPPRFAANIDMLTLADGKQADWRADLAGALLTKQREDGSWANANGRWMESNPVLVTAYTLLSMEQIYDSIPE